MSAILYMRQLRERSRPAELFLEARTAGLPTDELYTIRQSKKSKTVLITAPSTKLVDILQAATLIAQQEKWK